MPIHLGTPIAERQLEAPKSGRRILARLGRPRRSARAPWECPYQIHGGGDARVRRAFGEDALQTLLLACVALRAHLQLLGASWLSLGSSGIPPHIPDIFGPQFTAHLEATVDREVATFVKKLERAQKRKPPTNKLPANQALQPTSRAGGAGGARRRARGSRLNAGR